jgi:hypothetical protein
MQFIQSTFLCGLAVIAGLGVTACSTAKADTPVFTLSSPDLVSGNFDNKFVLNGFGCSGENVSPAPKPTRSPSTIRMRQLAVGSGTGRSTISQLQPLSFRKGQGRRRKHFLLRRLAGPTTSKTLAQPVPTATTGARARLLETSPIATSLRSTPMQRQTCKRRG